MRYRNAETIMFGVNNANINEDIKFKKSNQNHWCTGGFVF